MSRLMKRVLMGSALLSFTTPVMAAEGADETPPDHSVAISVSPIHLFLPVAEVQVEIYATPMLSISLIGGYGSVTIESTYSDDESFKVWEIGGQVRAYPIGSTQEGFYLGGEVLKVGISGSSGSVSGTADGVGISGIAGYKWVWESGFLIDLNGGAGHIAAQAETSDGSTSEDSQVTPVLNFNLGWAL